MGNSRLFISTAVLFFSIPAAAQFPKQIDEFDTKGIFNPGFAGKAGAACMSDEKDHSRFFPSRDKFPRHCFDYKGAAELAPATDGSKDAGRLVYLSLRPLDPEVDKAESVRLSQTFPYRDDQVSEKVKNSGYSRATLPRGETLFSPSDLKRKPGVSDEDARKLPVALRLECERVKKLIDEQYGGTVRLDTNGHPEKEDPKAQVVTFYMPPADSANPNAMSLHLLPQTSRGSVFSALPRVYGHQGPRYVEPLVSGISTDPNEKGRLQFPKVEAAPFSPQMNFQDQIQYSYNCPNSVKTKLPKEVGDFKITRFINPYSTYYGKDKQYLKEGDIAFHKAMINNLSVPHDEIMNYVKTCDQKPEGSHFSLNPPVISPAETYISGENVVDRYLLRGTTTEVSFEKMEPINVVGAPNKIFLVKTEDQNEIEVHYRVTEKPGHTAKKPNLELVRIDQNIIDTFDRVSGTRENQEAFRKKVLEVKADADNTFAVNLPRVPRTKSKSHMLVVEAHTRRCHLVEINPKKSAREIATSECEPAKDGAGYTVKSKTQEWFWGPTIVKTWKRCNLAEETCGDIKSGNGLEMFFGGKDAYLFKTAGTDHTGKFETTSDDFMGPCTRGAKPGFVFPPRQQFGQPTPSTVRLPATQ